MKRSILVALACAGAALAASPASAAMLACTSENMAKSVSMSTTMQDGPQKMAMMKEMGTANAAMAKGDMRGACKSYMRAQQMGSAKPPGGMKM
jgi:hypothetical protein